MRCLVLLLIAALLALAQAASQSPASVDISSYRYFIGKQLQTTIYVYDAAGNAYDFIGTLQISVNDPAAVLPAQVVVNNASSVKANFTFNTYTGVSQTLTLTITDAANSSATWQFSVSVYAAGVALLNFPTAPIKSGDWFSFQLQTLDQHGQFLPQGAEDFWLNWTPTPSNWTYTNGFYVVTVVNGTANITVRIFNWGAWNLTINEYNSGLPATGSPALQVLPVDSAGNALPMPPVFVPDQGRGCAMNRVCSFPLSLYNSTNAATVNNWGGTISFSANKAAIVPADTAFSGSQSFPFTFESYSYPSPTVVTITWVNTSTVIGAVQASVYAYGYNYIVPAQVGFGVPFQITMELIGDANGTRVYGNEATWNSLSPFDPHAETIIPWLFYSTFTNGTLVYNMTFNTYGTYSVQSSNFDVSGYSNFYSYSPTFTIMSVAPNGTLVPPPPVFPVLTISGDSIMLGEAADISVQMYNSSTAGATSYTGTLQISCNDSSAVYPASISITNGQRATLAKSATFHHYTGVNGFIVCTVADPNNALISSSYRVHTYAADYKWSVPASIAAGDLLNVSITALDENGNTIVHADEHPYIDFNNVYPNNYTDLGGSWPWANGVFFYAYEIYTPGTYQLTAVNNALNNPVARLSPTFVVTAPSNASTTTGTAAPSTTTSAAAAVNAPAMSLLLMALAVAITVYAL